MTNQSISIDTAKATHNAQEAKLLAAILATETPKLLTAMFATQDKAYGAACAYAAKLNSILSPDWFDLDLPATGGDNAECAVRVERDAHHNAARAKYGKSHNPSVNWKRVRQYAAEVAGGARSITGKLVKGRDGVAEGASGRGPGGAVNPPRSLLLRNQDELIKLLKANANAKDAPQSIQDASKHIAAALKAIGTQQSIITAAMTPAKS